MGKDEFKHELEEIADLLESGHEEQFAVVVRNAMFGTAQALEEFLKSNDLWGGAGSIADQAFERRSPHRKELESKLIRLGRMLLDNGTANVRTLSWVEAFEKWQRLGI